MQSQHLLFINIFIIVLNGLSPAASTIAAIAHESSPHAPSSVLAPLCALVYLFHPRPLLSHTSPSPSLTDSLSALSLLLSRPLPADRSPPPTPPSPLLRSSTSPGRDPLSALLSHPYARLPVAGCVVAVRPVFALSSTTLQIAPSPSIGAARARQEGGGVGETGRAELLEAKCEERPRETREKERTRRQSEQRRRRREEREERRRRAAQAGSLSLLDRRRGRGEGKGGGEERRRRAAQAGSLSLLDRQ